MASPKLRGLCVVVCLTVLSSAHAAFYLPGVSPQRFAPRAMVPMQVNKITSTKTQLPYRYYDLPFCKPSNVDGADLNLGQLLAGDSIESSDYKLFMKFHEYCKVLCVKQYTDKQAKKFASKIRDEYTVHWILDNLPAAVRFLDTDDDAMAYTRGFPLGYEDESGTYLFNHMRFLIKYNEAGSTNNEALIVGFEVEPFSVHHTYDGDLDEFPFQLHTCNDAVRVRHNMPSQRIDRGGEVVFTYDVKWEPSDVKWTERWNIYLTNTSDDGVHWFSITNSVLVVVLLTCMVAMIMVRVVCKDIARYNDATLEEAVEDSGWKLVHGDVFRPPSGTFGPIALSVFIGSGVQLLMLMASVMVFAILGFLSPAHRGGLLTALLLLYVLNGFFGGYVAARVYKMFDGQTPTRTTLFTAVSFPSLVFSIAFVINLFVWHQGSSSAVPIGTMFAVLLLWLGVGTPLVFLGAFFGYRKDKIENPSRVKQIARAIPQQPSYMQPLAMYAVGGVLPFAAVFIELFFIMSSIWEEQTYYVFGFLLLSLVLLVLTCAEISVVMVYFLLCCEDHRWWWRAYLTSGASAVYIFVYSAIYFFTNLSVTSVAATLMYFGYMFLISVAFFLLTGSVGFLASLVFVRAIYSAVKIE